MELIRIILYFKDGSRMAIDSFEEARECIQAYLSFSDSVGESLRSEDVLTNATCRGLTTPQEAYIQSQIERINPSIYLGVNHD